METTKPSHVKVRSKILTSIGNDHLAKEPSVHELKYPYGDILTRKQPLCEKEGTTCNCKWKKAPTTEYRSLSITVSTC